VSAARARRTARFCGVRRPLIPAPSPLPQDLAEFLSAALSRAAAPDEALAALDALAARHVAGLRTLTKRLQVGG
jgi:hypothetical protein